MRSNPTPGLYRFLEVRSVGVELEPEDAALALAAAEHHRAGRVEEQHGAIAEARAASDEPAGLRRGCSPRKNELTNKGDRVRGQKSGLTGSNSGRLTAEHHATDCASLGPEGHTCD